MLVYNSKRQYYNIFFLFLVAKIEGIYIISQFLKMLINIIGQSSKTCAPSLKRGVTFDYKSFLEK